MKETDLFPPVRQLFEAQGYTVNAEVNRCDVVARQADRLIVIELKTALNLSLITQAVDRQALTPEVYVAFPRPGRVGRRARTCEAILRRLGLGLIYVQQSPLRTSADIAFDPDHDGAIDARKRAALERELAGRSIEPNIGGSTGVKVYTAYRETAVTIALLLERQGPTRVRDLKPLAGDRTQSVLAGNHYGWFDRIQTGVYDLSEAGRSALSDYDDLRRLFQARFPG